MYALYAPAQAVYKESKSLKGIAKMKFDREHKDSLTQYPELRERLQKILEQGEKITPKQWKAEIQSLQVEYDSIGKDYVDIERAALRTLINPKGALEEFNKKH